MVLLKTKTEEEYRKQHFMHATSDQMIAMYLADTPGRKRVNILPVCPRCEKLGLRDKGWNEKAIMTCPHCGYSGPTDIIYSEYAKEKNFL